MKPAIVCTLPLENSMQQQIRRTARPYQVRYLPARSGQEVDRALDPSVEILLTAAAPTRLDQAPALRWVQLNSAGINHIMQSPIYQRHDLVLTTARGVYDVAAAEFALGLMLSLTRNFPRALEMQRERKWCPNNQRLEVFPNQELRGRRVGILGYGGIGQEIARLCQAFGMRPSALLRGNRRAGEARYRLPELRRLRLPELERVFEFPRGLGPLLEQSDFVVVTLPLTPETAGLIDESAFARMKSGAYFINIARGALVKEAALIRALRQGRIAGAALDVFEQEPLPADSAFYQLGNVILTPHISGVFTGMISRVAALFAENLERYLKGRTLFNQVDRQRGY